MGDGVMVVTVGEALDEARQKLAAAGIGDARREADELYAAIVCGAMSSAFEQRELPIGDVVAGRLLLAVERRARGWPQAYAAGRANFRGHWLAVDQRVLIPRPETEGLVDLVIGALKPGQTVADICTGSGAIALALALESPAAGVIATDVSADALNVALENAQALGANERISFRRGDLLAPLLDDVVDVVVSNPPYVASGEWAALEPGVRDYEPRLALDGGVDGLDVTRALIAQASEHLAPGGLLALEVDARRAQQTAALATAAHFTNVEIRADLFGRPRYVLGRRS
jgi:release factor glutamine methyltransferase